MPTPIVIRDVNYAGERTNPNSVVRAGDGAVATSIRGPISPESNPTQSVRNHATTRMGDLSTSPRLFGYVFSFLSSAVALTSSVMFYVRGVFPANSSTLEESTIDRGINITKSELETLQERYNSMNFSGKLFFSSGGVVTQDYQVYGSIVVSGLLTAITLFVLFAHLDSFCCPNKFRYFFRDGSLSERNLILVLIVISAISLHISTSRFSVGEAQTNVFFSTWTNFISCAVNFEVWRTGAGRHFSFQNIIFDRDFPLKRHWFFMSIFTSITFLSMVDYLMNNNIISNKSDWNCLKLSWQNKWLWMSLGLTVLSWGAFFMRRFVAVSKLVQQIAEMLIVSAQVAISGYVIVNLTGGRLDQISCPSNLYFSIWGSFFTGIWIFSSLLQTWGA
eukprot:CCRYP_012122-RA/>CCRYP_012122-RA protein AED:0.03 eAED:0.03 QI:177/1/1/1/0/0.5/2/1171/389